MKDSLGQWGEDRAVEYLRNRDWTIRHRNYETPYGECDLVARRGDTTAFVEVKTRKSREYGSPESAVDRRKREHLRRVAKHYLREEEDSNQPRFDVVAIEFDPDNPTIRHLEGAFGVNS